MTIIILLMVVGWLTYRATSAAERNRFLERALRKRRQLADRINRRHAQIAPFWNLLRQRTCWAPVTPALVAVNVVVFVLMLFGPDAISAPDTLIAWGGSFGPRTTNGEWWRLVTAMFVHVSALHLFADLIGLLAVGLVVERLVGSLAFAAVYVAAGMSSIAFGLIASPTGVSVGASGAIFGIYGLGLVVVIGSVFNSSMPKIPFAFARAVAPAIAVFIVYSLVTSAIASGPELSALFIGCVSGVFVARGIGEGPAPASRVAPVAIGAMVMVVVTVLPMSGMTDVRPEIHKLVTAEEDMAARYQKATDQFTSGRINVHELVAIIDHDIIPQLRASRTHLASLDHVPDEQKPLLAAAEKYLQLRDESWRVRSKALNVGSVSMLREADMSEVMSRSALKRLE
jgi:rhomboid protease GluP